MEPAADPWDLREPGAAAWGRRPEPEESAAAAAGRPVRPMPAVGPPQVVRPLAARQRRDRPGTPGWVEPVA